MAKKTYREQYFKIHRATVESTEFKALPYAAQLLFFHLCNCRSRFAGNGHSNGDRSFHRSNQLLCVGTGLSLPAVKRAKDTLARAHFISVDKSHRPPRYIINDSLFELADNGGESREKGEDDTWFLPI
jgi:hypothetical protein